MPLRYQAPVYQMLPAAAAARPADGAPRASGAGGGGDVSSLIKTLSQATQSKPSAAVASGDPDPDQPYLDQYKSYLASLPADPDPDQPYLDAAALQSGNSQTISDAIAQSRAANVLMQNYPGVA